VKGSGGTWTETVLHHFGIGTDGGDPQAELVFDSAGNHYGTTQCGGASAGGSILALTPGSSAPWSERILHSFANDPDSASPYAGVIVDSAGHLFFGTTTKGGSANFATAFEIVPRAAVTQRCGDDSISCMVSRRLRAFSRCLEDLRTYALLPGMPNPVQSPVLFCASRP